MSNGYWPLWPGRRHRLFGKRVIAILKLDRLSKVSQEGSLVGGLGGARVVIASRKGKGETEALLTSAKKARDVLLAGAPLVQLPSRFALPFIIWFFASFDISICPQPLLLLSCLPVTFSLAPQVSIVHLKDEFVLQIFHCWSCFIGGASTLIYCILHFSLHAPASASNFKD